MEVAVYRTFDRPPFQRYACVLVEDVKTPDGFRLQARDPSVADGEFLVKLHEHMMQPQLVPDLVKDGTVTINIVRPVNPGEHEHFGAAVRTIPHTILGPKPE